jgi:hypothetical protein
VFITYRRVGGFELARLIYEDLQRRGYHPFMDIEDLRSGPFNAALYQRIEEVNDVVVVLSAGALDSREGEDWLRLEVAHAFKNGKNVVPVFTRDFVWPPQLPADIAALRHQNGVPPSGVDYFSASLDRLARLLHPAADSGRDSLGPTVPRVRSRSTSSKETRSWRRYRGLAVAAIGLVVVLPGIWVYRSRLAPTSRPDRATPVSVAVVPTQLPSPGQSTPRENSLEPPREELARFDELLRAGKLGDARAVLSRLLSSHMHSPEVAYRVVKDQVARVKAVDALPAGDDRSASLALLARERVAGVICQLSEFYLQIYDDTSSRADKARRLVGISKEALAGAPCDSSKLDDRDIDGLTQSIRQTGQLAKGLRGFTFDD